MQAMQFMSQMGILASFLFVKTITPKFTEEGEAEVVEIAF